LRNHKTQGSAYLLWICCLVLVLGFFAWNMVDAEATSTKQEPSEAEGQDKTQTPSAGVETDLDTTHWKTIRSKYGWKIKYPKNWEPDDPEAAKSGLFNIYGPIGPGECQIARCAIITVDSEVFQGNTKKSLEEFLQADKLNYDYWRRELQIGGAPAFDVCCLYDEHHEPMRKVAFRYHGRIMDFTYTEGGKADKPIESPNDWKYVSIFDKMLESLSFFEVPESVWPKN